MLFVPYVHSTVLALPPCQTKLQLLPHSMTPLRVPLSAGGEDLVKANTPKDVLKKNVEKNLRT